MYEIHRLRVRTLARTLLTIGVMLHVLSGIIIAVLYVVLRTAFLHQVFGVSMSVVTLLLIWLAGTAPLMVLWYLLGLIVGGAYNLMGAWWGGITVDLVNTQGVVGDHGHEPQPVVVEKSRPIQPKKRKVREQKPEPHTEEDAVVSTDKHEEATPEQPTEDETPSEEIAEEHHA